MKATTASYVQLYLATLILACTISGTSLAATRSIPQADETRQQTEPQAKPAAPKPNPDASGKYHVGNGVSAPKLIYQVEPEFSEKARKKKLNGTCVVSLTVDVNGKTTDVHLVTSIAGAVDKRLRAAAMELDENCIKTVEQYRFTPGTYQGKPVPVELKIEVNFQIY